MKNKKGFTLVELLAVIVVLVIISILAINKITDVMKTNTENSVRANALTFIKALEDQASISRITNNFNDGIYSSDELINMGVKLSGTKPNSGQVFLQSGKVKSACLTYSKYYANYKNGKVTNIKKGNCGTLEVEIPYDFNFTGSEQIFTATYSGNYKLEVWGAQGGNGQESSDSTGGSGGYSVGYIYLNSGDNLYVTVGGKGDDNTTQEGTSGGGYNGGGRAYRAGGGGGATHIATRSGLLSTLENYKDTILIVGAGGGGGSASRSTSTSKGGSGGGYIGENGYKEGNRCGASGDNRCAIAGNQETGGITTWGDENATYRGLFGAGGPAAYFTIGGAGAMGGGGSGYYGGSGTYDSDSDLDSGGGAGGSSYINAAQLSNGKMYCNNCTATNIKFYTTDVVNCSNAEAKKECAKLGNGYARITFLAGNDDFTSKFDGYTKLKYIQSTGSEYINTGYYMKPSTKIYIIGMITSGNSGWAQVTGARNSYHSSSALQVAWNSNTLAIDYGTAGSSTTVYQDSLFKVQVVNNNLYINTTSITQSGTLTATSPYPLWIFDENAAGGGENRLHGRIYSYQIYEGTNRIKDFVPCINNTSNEVGLCDLVSGQFYGNANSIGAFTPGY